MSLTQLLVSRNKHKAFSPRQPRLLILVHDSDPVARIVCHYSASLRLANPCNVKIYLAAKWLASKIAWKKLRKLRLGLADCTYLGAWAVITTIFSIWRGRET